MFGHKYTRLLLHELARLAVAEKSYDLRIDIDREGLPAKAREQFELLAQTLQNCRDAAEYDLAKYRLTNNALGVAQWDADVVPSDPVNPSNKFNWSKEFRRALGFFDEGDFPDILSSWSSRLHPEDREIVLAALAAHITDITGKTPYDLEYRMQTKDGEYRRFRAVGLTMRDEDGVPLKVAGALEDITGRARQREMLENILNGMDSYIYTTDLETDEMLFVNRKMMDGYHLPQSIKGEKCWQRLQSGQTGRCAWCKKDRLTADSNAAIPWEDDNPVLGNCIYKIDRVIDWPGGRRVHMQQGVDITEMKRARESLRQREKTLNALNRAALVILSRKDEAFEDAMTEGIGLLSGIADFDRMSLIQNRHGPNGLRFSQIYRWNKEAKGTTKALDELADVAYAELFPRWEGVLSAGECVNGPVSLMPEAEVLKRFGCVALAAVPVLNEDVFWGFALFENRSKEKAFSEQEIDVLRSASVMLANVVIRNDEAVRIREANQYVKLMLDATPLACRLWDQNLKLLECNEAAVTLFGLKDKQEYRDRYWELAPEYQPDGQISRDRIQQSIADAFRTGKYVFDCMYRLPDGTPLPAQNTLIRVPYGDSYVVAAYSRDLREQKRMTAEIEQRDHLLQTVNEAIDKLLRTEPEGFAEILRRCMGMIARSICADRMYIHKNNEGDEIRHHANLYEWPEEGLGNAEGRGVPVSLACGGKAPLIDKMLQSGESVQCLIRDLPPDCRRCFKTRGVQSIMIIPVFLQDEFWGFVGFDRCGSEELFTPNEESIMRSGSMLIASALIRNEYILNIRETSAKLETALYEAKLANNAKSDFLASMSHEMRTPLNAIIGYSEIALDDGGISEDAKSYLEKIYGSGSTLLSIINDLLDFTKIQAGRFEIRPNQYDIPSLINDSVLQNVLRIGSRPIRFILDISADMPACLHGDEVRVKQIINNLLSNAIKYTERGEVELSLRCERDGGKAWITIRVRDTGIGIRQENMKRLFNNYTQIGDSPHLQTEGTGLGLAITKSLVEMMDGTVSVESEFGKGSVFTARFRQGYISDAAIGSEVAESLANFQYSASKLSRNTRLNRLKLPYARVLIVDDNITNLDVAKGFMMSYGMRTDCVTSGQAAVQAIRRGDVKYNAVFMDHMMPEMDGVEAARRIREIGTDYARTLPIIALTANAVAGSEDMFMANGFQGFISKPINLARLDEMIRRFVRDREREKSWKGSEEENAPLPGKEEDDRPSFRVEEINGVDVSEGIAFYGDGRPFAKILRSYAVNTRPLLESLKQVREDTLTSYAITVHGIKSASRNIFAETVSALAEELELAAKTGDFDVIAGKNPAFIASVQWLIEDIEAALGRMEDAHPKPLKDSPDPGVLARLRMACESFDFDGIESSMEEIDRCEYSADGGLAVWLRENVVKMNWAQIIEKISMLAKETE